MFMDTIRRILIIVSLGITILSIITPWMYLLEPYTFLRIVANMEYLKGALSMTNEEIIYVMLTTIFLVIGVILTLAGIGPHKLSIAGGLLLISSGILWAILIDLIKTRIGFGAILLNPGIGHYMIILAGIIAAAGGVFKKVK